MTEEIKFFKGLERNLPKEPEDGIYYATDTGRMYLAERKEYTPYNDVFGIYKNLEDLANAYKVPEKLYILEEDKKADIYMYDNRNKKFKVLDLTKDKLRQVTKLNVVASKENPKTITIPIEYTNDFKKLPLEVLKMEGEDGKDKIEILADFDNSDKDDFFPNEFVEMDGTMRLKTNWIKECEIVNEEENIYSFDLNWLDNLDVIESFNIG